MTIDTIKSGMAAALVALSLGGCLPASRFEWGTYEGSLYAYAKRPDQKAAFRLSLERAIQRGVETNRVAPGLNAELGYLYLEDGEVARAVALFEEEMRLFPESRAFLTDVVSRAKGGDAGPTGASGDAGE